MQHTPWGSTAVTGHFARYPVHPMSVRLDWKLFCPKWKFEEGCANFSLFKINKQKQLHPGHNETNLYKTDYCSFLNPLTMGLAVRENSLSVQRNWILTNWLSDKTTAIVGIKEDSLTGLTVSVITLVWPVSCACNVTGHHYHFLVTIYWTLILTFTNIFTFIISLS